MHNDIRRVTVVHTGCVGSPQLFCRFGNQQWNKIIPKLWPAPESRVVGGNRHIRVVESDDDIDLERKGEIHRLEKGISDETNGYDRLFDDESLWCKSNGSGNELYGIGFRAFQEEPKKVFWKGITRLFGDFKVCLPMFNSWPTKSRKIKAMNLKVYRSRRKRLTGGDINSPYDIVGQSWGLPLLHDGGRVKKTRREARR